LTAAVIVLPLAAPAADLIAPPLRIQTSRDGYGAAILGKHRPHPGKKYHWRRGQRGKA
jgi:hypothetical protein